MVTISASKGIYDSDPSLPCAAIVAGGVACSGMLLLMVELWFLGGVRSFHDDS